MDLRGLGNTLDVGATLSFDYALPGNLVINPGLQAGFLAKPSVIDSQKLTLVVHLPLTMHRHFGAATLFALGLPLQGIVGIPLSDKLVLHTRLELAMRHFLRAPPAMASWRSGTAARASASPSSMGVSRSWNRMRNRRPHHVT